jgi:hypothetical protein
MNKKGEFLLVTSTEQSFMANINSKQNYARHVAASVATIV